MGPGERYQGKNQSKTFAWRFPRDATAIPSDPGRIKGNPGDGPTPGFQRGRGQRDSGGLDGGQGPVKVESRPWTEGTRCRELDFARNVRLWVRHNTVCDLFRNSPGGRCYGAAAQNNSASHPKLPPCDLLIAFLSKAGVSRCLCLYTSASSPVCAYERLPGRCATTGPQPCARLTLNELWGPVRGLALSPDRRNHWIRIGKLFSRFKPRSAEVLA